MKYITKSESGYTLLITLGVLVLFTIIGMSLMTLNLNSLSKNESRENNIQAKDLSVKGIDYILAEIDYKMDKESLTYAGITYPPLENGLKGEAFLKKFSELLNSYKCDVFIKELDNTSTGDSQFCVTKIEDVPNTNGFQKFVTFKSVGTANTKEHTTESTYKLGADVDNDAFDYAIMTYENDAITDNQLKQIFFEKTTNLNAQQNKYFNYYKNTRGNIELHGGLKVAGNIRSDQNFYISDQSRYKDVTVPSILPIIESNVPNKNARIEVQGSRAVLNNSLGTVLPQNNIKNNDIHIGDGTSIKGEFEDTGEVEVDFDIVNKVNNAAFDFTTAGVDITRTQGITWEPNYGLRILSLTEKYIGYNFDTTSKSKTVLEHYDVVSNAQRREAQWYLSRTNKFNTIAFPNNVHLKYGTAPANTNPSIDVSNYAYIGNDFIIGLNNADEVNFDLFNNVLAIDALGILGGLESLTNIETPVELKGTYYVNGDLIISGARLYGNATFFVKGNTYIAFSEIGVPPIGQALEEYTEDLKSESNISIFSHGPMNISYLSNNHNNYAAAYRDGSNNSDLLSGITKPLSLLRDDYTRSVWNGHLHSDTSINIDASTSYMTINGSISAPKVFATSIKGRTEPSCINIGTGLDYTIRFLLNDVLSYLLGPTLTNILTNLLIGEKDSQPDAQMNRIATSNQLSSNCFQKAELQGTDVQPFPSYTASLLNLNLLPWGNNQYYPLEPRLIINYSEKPKIDYLRYVTITSLDKPQQISRE